MLSPLRQLMPQLNLSLSLFLPLSPRIDRVARRANIMIRGADGPLGRKLILLDLTRSSFQRMRD